MKPDIHEDFVESVVAYLTRERLRLDTTAVQFTPSERQRIVDKAFEQANRQAELAKVDPLHLLPAREPWPFRLTDDDRAFLRVNKISPA